MSKSINSVSIIGGADGPTSIFLVGSKYKDKNVIRQMHRQIQNKKNQIKRKRAEKSIVPRSHTLDETIQYMIKNYGMIEADSSYPSYEECRRGMRFSLAQAENAELLGEQPQSLELHEFQNQEAIRRWHKALDKWEEQAQKIVDMLPPEVVSMDYHMFVLNKGEEGTLEIEIERERQLIQMQYSGDCKLMNAIIKDIHLYYGVSQQDIEEKTERYQNLLAVLTM